LINSREPNQADIYFFGLKQILGASCIEYPYKPSYHLKKINGKLTGLNERNEVEVEEEEGGFLHFLRLGLYVPSYFGLQDEETYPFHRDEPDLSDFDSIVAWMPPEREVYLERILRSKWGKSLLLLDGRDDPFIRPPYFNRRVTKYFKREILNLLPRNNDYLLKWLKFYAVKKLITPINNLTQPIFPAISNLKGIVPLNLTTDDQQPPQVRERDIDISFIAAPNNSYRMDVGRFIASYARRNRLKAYIKIALSSNQTPFKEYRNIIARSKISLSVQGAGFDTYRYWEIPCYGSALISQTPFIVVKNNFTDGKDALFFDNLTELEAKLDYALKGHWEDIAKSGRRHFLKYHTCRSRAREILQSVYNTF
jgi:hypothetical protein